MHYPMIAIVTLSVLFASSTAVTDEQQAALDRLAQQVEGWVVYSQQEKDVEGGWMVRKMKIGEWKPIDLGPGRFARWSPDGRLIAVWLAERQFNEHYGIGSVFVMTADGKDRKLLMKDVVAFQFRTGIPIDFHPDGKRVIVSKGNRSSPHGTGGDLYFVNIADGSAEKVDLKLKSDQSVQTEPQMSADGRFLAIRTSGLAPPKGGGGNGELSVFDLKTGEHRLYGRGCMTGMSPDGEWLFQNYRGHNRMTFHHRTDEERKIFINTRDKIDEPLWDAAHWSNHPHWLAIRGEGREWPVYIGHFDEDPDKITFTRVVFEGGKCEYPDLFVSKDKLE